MTAKKNEHDPDPTVNALLSIAAAIKQLAEATNGLFYGLKFGRQEGLSIAEALEHSGTRLVDAVTDLADKIDSRPR